LIYPDDAKDFSSIMDATWQSIGRNTVDKATKQYWFGKLQHLALGDVANAFDKYIMSGRDKPPQLTDILHAVKPVEFFKALPSHHDPEIRKDGVDKVNTMIAEHINTERNYKAWADKIIANPDRYSYIAVRYAKEALRV
jgi:hypothetical protein|tara:strand:- start:1079 stop:1495 length:417 start_codon:yes stop_codon:yes gene_type:complete